MSSPTQYTLNTTRAAAVVATWALASDSARTYGYAGTDHAAGLIASLYGAELLAEAAGFAAPAVIFNGVQVSTIAASRSQAKAILANPPSDQNKVAAATLYLAQYGTVRLLHDTAVQRQTTTGYGLLPAPDALPLVVPVVIAVVAIAGVIAAAWYATSTKATDIEVQGHNLRQAQLANSYTAVGLAALKAGQPIPAGVWQGLEGLAAQEASHNAWVAPTLIVAGMAAGGGLVAWGVKRYRGRR